MPSALGDRLFIDCLVKQEKLLAKLYNMFAQMMPEHRDFWFQLSQDEHRHQEMLKRLSKAIGDGEVVLDGDRYEAFAIKQAMDDLAEQVNAFARGTIELKDAFQFAAGTERQILERCFIDPHRHQDALVRETMRAIVASGEDHARRIEERSHFRPKRTILNLFGLLSA